MAQTATFRLLDTRVGASLLNATDFDMVVRGNRDTADAFATLADMAYVTRIERLLLICHSWHNDATGDWALLIGDPGLGHDNLRVLAPLRDKFGGVSPRVELRGCWIATNPGGAPDAAVPASRSGAALCHRIADLLGVDVWGSDSEQPGPCGEFAPIEYDERTVADAGQLSIVRKQAPTRRECSEGDWNGKVYIYSPGRAGARRLGRR
jgi:hypothetical protein